jgi:hypothetical protein
MGHFGLFFVLFIGRGDHIPPTTLHAAGSTADFEHIFSLGAAKKSLAREYPEKVASTQVG